MVTFNASQHPRAAAGSATGGQFISYKASSKRGTGYGHKDGDPRVRRLQEALNRFGLTDSKGHHLVVDGQLGPLTTQAIKAAQAKLGMKQDGRVNGALLDRLTHLSKRDLATAANASVDAWIRSSAKKPAKKPATTTTAATAAPSTSASKTAK